MADDEINGGRSILATMVSGFIRDKMEKQYKRHKHECGRLAWEDLTELSAQRDYYQTFLLAKKQHGWLQWVRYQEQLYHYF